MTLEEALKIREIKRRCTYRALAEKWYPKGEPCHGNQGCGEGLCQEALKVLYPNDDIWMMYKPEMKFGKQFVLDNCSQLFSKKRFDNWLHDGGDCDKIREYDLFYWWE